MSFTTLKKVIDLIDAGRKFFAKALEKTREFTRRRLARKIRDAVDADDDNVINAIVRRIKKKRRDRIDSG